jgi:arylsulfatase A-like enzyme
MRIIYFDIDCLRPDHLGCYGYDRPTSSNIDKIASNGVRFDHYYCSSSPCMPSRTAWSSGRFGIRNGVCSNLGAGADFHIKLSDYGGPHPENEMLMRQLRQYSGLHTVSFSTFADRHSAYYFMCGFSEFHTPNLKGGMETADEVNPMIMRWLEANQSRDDYFLHINYWDAHRPYRIDPDWDPNGIKSTPVTQAWPDKDTIDDHQKISGPFTANGQFKNDTSPYPLMPGSIKNREDFEKMITGYDLSIAYIDEHIGQIIAFLERTGQIENTAIIISSDHGDAFGEHGIYSDHVCADECIHRIPLIINWPGITERARTCEDLIYNVDLPPTLCDILDVPAPADWDGLSFRAALEGRPFEGREYLVWDHGLYAIQRAVRTRDHLMIRTYDDFGYSINPIELYKINEDPYQQKNIAAQHPDIVEHCMNLMEKWIFDQGQKEPNVIDPLFATLKERSQQRNLYETVKNVIESDSLYHKRFWGER